MWWPGGHGADAADPVMTDLFAYEFGTRFGGASSRLPSAQQERGGFGAGVLAAMAFAVRCPGARG